MKRLYYDTETTGFPKKGDAPLEEQPHIVQLAALLVDDEAGEIASLNVIIKPDGWEVGEGAAEVHGITTEKALALGIPIEAALPCFLALVAQADQLVAHNIQFDRKLIGYAIARSTCEDTTRGKPEYCTMLATTDVCKLPGRYGSYKWPKLIEAHEHIFGEGFDGAHDALADVRACQRVHAHLIGIKVTAPEPDEIPV